MYCPVAQEARNRFKNESWPTLEDEEYGNKNHRPVEVNFLVTHCRLLQHRGKKVTQ